MSGTVICLFCEVSEVCKTECNHHGICNGGIQFTKLQVLLRAKFQEILFLQPKITTMPSQSVPIFPIVFRLTKFKRRTDAHQPQSYENKISIRSIDHLYNTLQFNKFIYKLIMINNISPIKKGLISLFIFEKQENYQWDIFAVVGAFSSYPNKSLLTFATLSASSRFPSCEETISANQRKELSTTEALLSRQAALSWSNSGAEFSCISRVWHDEKATLIRPSWDESKGSLHLLSVETSATMIFVSTYRCLQFYLSFFFS